MRVRVKFYATLRDMASLEESACQLEPGACGLDLRRYLAQQHGQVADLLNYCRLAVNLEYVSWDVTLHDGDELSIIPPVSGG